MDYSKSAVNLTNPNEVAEILAVYHTEEGQIAAINTKIEECVPQNLKDELNMVQESHKTTVLAIREAIDIR